MQLKPKAMKAIAKIDTLKTVDSKFQVIRNLSRILDLRILDIDLEFRTIHFVYDSIAAFEKAKRELWSIGHPITHFRYQEPHMKYPSERDSTMVVF